MELSSSDVLKKLPDFEDIMDIGSRISGLLIQKLTVEKDIKVREAEIMKIVMSDPQYFVGGKQPSVAFTETAYMYTGLNMELVPMRELLHKTLADLERERIRLDLYKEFLNMWRTLNASERSISA